MSQKLHEGITTIILSESVNKGNEYERQLREAISQNEKLKDKDIKIITQEYKEQPFSEILEKNSLKEEEVFVVTRSEKVDTVAAATMRNGAGTDNVLEKEKITNQGRVVMNAPGDGSKEMGNSCAVAELAMGFAQMALGDGAEESSIISQIIKSRNINSNIEQLNAAIEGSSSPEERQAAIAGVKKGSFRGDEVINSPEILDKLGEEKPFEGKKVLVMTAGAIGKIEIQLFQAAGAEVSVWHNNMTDHQAGMWGVKNAGRDEKDIKKAMEEMDLVFVNTPDIGKPLIGKDELKSFNGHIIATSRPTLLDPEATKEYTERTGKKVFVDGKKIGDFLGHEGIICTNHIGSETHQAQANIARQSIRNVVEFLAEGKVNNLVNRGVTEVNEAYDYEPDKAQTYAMTMLIPPFKDTPERAYYDEVIVAEMKHIEKKVDKKDILKGAKAEISKMYQQDVAASIGKSTSIQ